MSPTPPHEQKQFGTIAKLFYPDDAELRRLEALVQVEVDEALSAANERGATLTVQAGGDITVPGRKFLDIVRALPEKSNVTFSLEGEKVVVRAGKSRFTLTTLPASDFPAVEEINPQLSFDLDQAALKGLLDKTHFSMAQQDVRYYLNGMLLESDGKMLRTVATDGHRLALSEMELAVKSGTHQVIVPRKGVLELQRLVGSEGVASLQVGSNHIRITIGDIRFTSKLIDGRFPEYGRVIPAAPGRLVKADREALRRALHRTSILANEKYRGIRLALRANLLVLTAHNPEQEEAEEEVEVAYEGEEFEVDLPPEAEPVDDAVFARYEEKLVEPTAGKILLRGEDITIYGDGNQTRTFCFIEDHLDATINAFYNNLVINDVANIGTDNEMTILELAKAIIKVTNSRSNIIHMPALKEGDMSRRRPDVTKMRELLNRDFTPLETGLKAILANTQFVLS